MRVTSNLPIKCWPPIRPMPRVVAGTNDPTMKVENLPGPRFRLSGRASDNGIMASFLSVKVDGKDIRVPLNMNCTPAQAFEELKKALPAGYTAHLRPVDRNSVIVRITPPPIR